MKKRELRDFFWKINNLDLHCEDVWSETYKIVSALYGIKILSVLYYLQNDKSFLSLFTSENRVHAAGVKMKYKKNEWSSRTLQHAEEVTFNDKMTILEQFEKGALLISLGYQATLSIPVLHQNKVVGVVNFVNEKDHFNDEWMADIRSVIKILLPYILDSGLRRKRAELWGAITELV
ncbi:GAF domain-containing protein [Pantoea cypripedii]|nr:GAF domain-containing protein [Pantoea cypripedii]